MIDGLPLFWIFGIFIALLFIIGIYCVIVTLNLIRTLIGIEIVTKAVTLLITLTGHLTGNTALAQTFIITLIIVEVVIIVVAAGLVLLVFRNTGTVNVRSLRHLKG